MSNINAKSLGHAFKMGVAFSLGRRFSNPNLLAEDAKVSDKIRRWITVNGTHIPIGKNGEAVSKTGRRIFSESKPKRLQKQFERGEKRDLRKTRTENTRTKLASKSEGNRTFTDPKLMQVQSSYSKQIERLPEIYEDINGIAKSIGALTIGKQFAAKTASSTQRKLLSKSEGKEENIKKEFDKLHDIVRFTVQSKHDDIVPTTNKLIKELEKKGYNINEVKNKYLNKNASYKGVHIIAEHPAKIPIEIQVHSPSSMRVKNTNHELYEIQRLSDTNPLEKEAIELEMRQNAARLPDPKGIKELKEWRKHK